VDHEYAHEGPLTVDDHLFTSEFADIFSIHAKIGDEVLMRNCQKILWSIHVVSKKTPLDEVQLHFFLNCTMNYLFDFYFSLL
jgi:hypothetical protein